MHAQFLRFADRFANDDPGDNRLESMKDKWSLADIRIRHGEDIRGI